MNAVTSPALRLHKLTAAGNPAIAHVTRQVSAEYGFTTNKSYTVADPNLGELYQVYSQLGYTYWVVKYGDEMVGGGGIVSLTGGESDICELQKVYLLLAIRSERLTKKLALTAVEQTREVGFKRCYSETTTFLKEATALYKHLGFEYIDYVFGCAGYVDCEVRMLHKL